MGRGIGNRQQQILDLVADEVDGIEVAKVADAVGCSASQVYRAVRSLKQRGLVIVTRSGSLGWRGLGEYGRLVIRTVEHGPDVPTAQVIRKGDPWPWPDQYGEIARANCDFELVRGGMPMPPALVVWNPECHTEFVAKFMALIDAVHEQHGEAPPDDDAMIGMLPISLMPL